MVHFIQKLIDKIPFLSPLAVGFDLGTHTTKIAIAGRGVVLREPSFVAIRTQPRDYIFFGTEAKTIIGKTPDFLTVHKPMVNGIISDFDSEVALLRYFLEKSVFPYINSSFIKPPILGVSIIPPVATEIEQKAVEEALLKTGCSSVELIKKPLASAIGAGLNVFYHQPHLIVDIGAGTVEISIVSGGGIVSHRSLKQAGDAMDKVIQNYVHLKHGVVLGEATCEKLKISALTFDLTKDTTEVVRGKSLENGLPKSVKIKSSELREALTPLFGTITDAVKEILEQSPPEVVNDVYQEGIVLTGKSSSIPGLDTYIKEEVHIDVLIPEHASEATVYGLLRLLQHPQRLKTLSLKSP